MNKHFRIENKKISSLFIRDKEHAPLGFYGSHVENSSIDNASIDSLVLFDSKVTSVSMGDSSVGNLVVSKNSVVYCCFIENSSTKRSHSIDNCLLEMNIVHKCLFNNGIYIKARFIHNVFVDTTFYKCLFSASVFQKCSFSGCLFYKCKFVNVGRTDPFVQSGFKPLAPLGQFTGQAHRWPSLANTKVKPTYFLKCKGNIAMASCSGVSNTIRKRKVPKNVIIPNVPSKKHNQPPSAYAYEFWNKVNLERNIPVKNKNRAYRFTTAGL